MAAASPQRSSRRRRTRGLTPKQYKEFSMAHQNVLLERMEKNMQAVADGHGFLQQTIERNHGEVCDRLDKVEVRLEKVEVRLGKVEGDVGQLKAGQARLEEIVLEILQRLKTLERRVEALEAKFDAHCDAQHLPADFTERFQQLEQRVSALEAHVA